MALIESRLSIGNSHDLGNLALYIVLLVVCSAVFLVVDLSLTNSLFRRWFPPLERLPDGGETRSDRARTWAGWRSAHGWLIAVVLSLPRRS